MNNDKLVPRILFFPAAIVWMELIIKWWTLGSPFGQGGLHTALFGIAIGLLIALLSCVGSPRVNKVLSAVVLGIVTFWFCANAVYHTIFKTFPALDSLTMAGDAIGSYWRETLTGILNTLPAIALLAIPFVVLMACILAPKGHRSKEKGCTTRAKILLLCAVM